MLFNCKKIIVDNFILTKEDSSWGHITFWVFIVPILIALLVYFINIHYINGSQANLVAFVSIVTGFLINISVVMLSDRSNQHILLPALRKRVQANIHYTILVGILIILMIIGKDLALSTASFINIGFLSPLFSATLTFFIIHYLLFILIILKGFYSALPK